MRRINAFIKDEQEAAKEYNKVSIEMTKEGRLDFAEVFREMAQDEQSHARNIMLMKASIKRK